VRRPLHRGTKDGFTEERHCRHGPATPITIYRFEVITLNRPNITCGQLTIREHADCHISNTQDMVDAMPVKSLYNWQIAACNKIQAPSQRLSFPTLLQPTQGKGDPLLGSFALASHALPNTSIHVFPRVRLFPRLAVRALHLALADVAFA